eukprot:TRINITY_DN35519_c0_g1_i1.p1 TRINITY_DN35519_c0_g1~~TRINITY_DN35519_c0_g1_i1.p1  ORF type:complete len:679 (+),score=255.56 TRINITY_DN35519_c0_g1_i1:91-2127(+)
MGSTAEVSFRVPLLRRTKELKFEVGDTVHESDGCVKWKLASDDQGNEFMMWLVLRDALDALPDQEEVERRINTQVAVLKLLDHANVVKLFQVFSTECVVYVLLERRPVPLSALLDGKGPLTAEKARDLCGQLLAGIAYLHSKNVVHRNIRPEDVLLDEDETSLVLAGFGYADLQQAGERMHDRPAGLHPVCAAPEVRSGTEPYDALLGDAWGFGCVVCAMLCGELPSADGRLPAAADGIPAAARDLLAQVLCVDPAKRSPLTALVSHLWLTDDSGHISPRAPGRNVSFIGDRPLNQTAVRRSFCQVSSSLQLDHRRLSRNMSVCEASPRAEHSPEFREVVLLGTPDDVALEPDGEVPEFRLSPKGAAGGRPKVANVFAAEAADGEAVAAPDFLVSPMHDLKQSDREFSSCAPLPAAAVAVNVAHLIDGVHWAQLTDAQRERVAKEPRATAERWLCGEVELPGIDAAPQSVQKLCCGRVSGSVLQDPDGSVQLRVRVGGIAREDDSEPWTTGQSLDLGSQPNSVTVTEVKRRVQAAMGIPVRRQNMSAEGSSVVLAGDCPLAAAGLGSPAVLVVSVVAGRRSASPSLATDRDVVASLQPHSSDVSGACCDDGSILAAWERFGAPKDGTITKEEFRKSLEEDDLGLDSALLKQLDACSGAGHNKLSFDEFSILMLRMAQR